MELDKAAKQAKEDSKKETEKPMTEEEIAEMRAEEAKTKAKIDELRKTAKPKAKQMFLNKECSIRDLLEAISRMGDYDRMMNDLEIIKECEFDQENAALKRAKRPYFKELVPLPEIEDHVQYSQDPEIQKLVEGIDDLTSIPEPPEWTKNAFAMTLFCMETAFDCRSYDFLKHAFELFPDRDYLIVTMPHTIPENALLNKFNLVGKKAQNTFSHVLYIFHRDYLFEQDIYVTRTLESDIANIRELITSDGVDQPGYEAAMAQTIDAIQNPDSAWVSFTARV
jgi:hypothetical protein